MILRALVILAACTPLAAGTGFRLLPSSETGVVGINRLSDEASLTNQTLLNGSGVALADVDGDGRTDIFVNALESPVMLLRNLGGWKFEDITPEAMRSGRPMGTGAAFADIDGDGDADLLAGAFFSGVRCYLNDGRGRFAAAPDNAGIRSGEAPMSLALADVDGDGDLDLFVANYRAAALMDQPGVRFSYRMRDGRPELTAVNGRSVDEADLRGRYSTVIRADGRIERVENGLEPDFYLNDGRGRFTRMPWDSGHFRDAEGKIPTTPMDWGLAAIFHDLDGDGAPELYVANDFDSPDRLWWNDGRGHFREAGPLAVRQAPKFAMGVDVADFDRDGIPDLLVVDMLGRAHRSRMTQVADGIPQPVSRFGRVDSKRNVLLRGRGDRTFAEIAHATGIEATDWSWGAAFLDVDLDGYEDLLVTSGNWRDSQNQDVTDHIEGMISAGKLPDRARITLRTNFASLPTGRSAWRNRAGTRFEDASARWGFDQPGVGQGIALGDLDGDGDLDVVTSNNLNSGPGLYRNDTEAPRVRVRLRGRPPNTAGIGARLVFRGGPVEQTQEIMIGGRYLSADFPERTFAAGPTNRLEVRWRSGAVSRLEGIPAGTQIEVSEGSASMEPAGADKTPTVWFESVALEAGHVDEAYDEQARQPALTRWLGRQGPAIAWWDLDGDGRQDLVVGGGTGSGPRAYRIGPEGALGELALTNTRAGDSAGWAAAATGQGRVLIGGLHGYEDDAVDAARLLAFHEKGAREIARTAASLGPMAAADVDGDGTLELFTGGGALPGRYPEAAPSLLWRQVEGIWKPDLEASGEFAGVGCVNGAVFSDLDGDGLPELLLATEWGPVRVFGNTAGTLVDASGRWGTAALTGWWRGIAAIDVDGDGDMDVVAGNWGSNSGHRAVGGHPATLRFGDVDGNGLVGLFETVHEPGIGDVPWRTRDALAPFFPWLAERFPTRAAYAAADISGVLGGRAVRTRTVTAATFESMLFLNTGGRLVARPLPREAQWSVVSAVCVADFDGDGSEDVFLGQNSSALSPEEHRQDAGRGLLLRGDGHGGLDAVADRVAGIGLDGDQRGAATCDYDEDGRTDLAVGQNDGPVALFRNRSASPGWRVRLEGPKGNPDGIGAMVWVEGDGFRGPAREIASGGGWWSQNSVVPVISRRDGAVRVRVRWPGGRTQSAPLPMDGNTVKVRWNP